MRLRRVEERLKQIDQEGAPAEYEPLINTVADMHVVAIREVISRVDDVADRSRALREEISTWAAQHRLKTMEHCLSINHGTEFSENNVDLEVAVPLVEVPKQFPELVGRITLRILEGTQEMVSVLHSGGRGLLPRAYAALIDWIQSNGYVACGPYRELNYRPEEAEGENGLIELQVPVESAIERLQKRTNQIDKKDNEMEPRYETRPAFMVVGMMYRGKNENMEINAMWNEFIPRFKEITEGDFKETFGVCRMLEDAMDGEFEYVAGVKVNKVDDLPEGMVARFVPEQKYAVFTHRGALEGLRARLDYIYQNWLPQSGHELTGGPDLEVYDENFKNFAEDSEFYIYVLIK